MQHEPTIFALASAPGRAGIAVLRLSGTQTAYIVQRLTRQPLPSPRHAVLRRLWRPLDSMLLDHAMLLWFPAPASFTGEDCAELHLHGGRAIVQSVSAALSGEPHVRLAEPGEFTRRAFMNGKLDLTAAEAVADLIHAETEAQLQQALRQHDGALARLYAGWAARLTKCLAHLEASIDFADDDLPPDLAARQAETINILATEISAHLQDERRGERLRDGFRIAILGAPNAGKSSLLNSLAQRDAAIVSATAGTTRDVLEVHLDLGGYPVILADTAGLRPTADTVEQEGIRRAWQQAEQADLKLLVLDGATWPSLDPLSLKLLDDRTFCILNKQDLLPPSTAPAAATLTLALPNTTATALPLSLQTGYGMETLLRVLTERVATALHDRGQPTLTRERHRHALQDGLQELRAAETGLHKGLEMALVAEHLRRTVRAIGRITGQVDVEAVLDAIFRDFCIGK